MDHIHILDSRWDAEAQFRAPQTRARILEIIQTVTAYGGMFEVNSRASLKYARKLQKQETKGEEYIGICPTAGVIQMIIENNGRLCLSDDAHAVEDVGMGYAHVKQVLKQLGVSTVYVLDADQQLRPNTI